VGRPDPGGAPPPARGRPAASVISVQREIRIAKQDYSKPIVAIRPWANEQVSSVVSDNADRLVGWNTDSIVSAIRELAP